MNITYKPSMFNHICKRGDDLVLYNSYLGIKNICVISSGKVNKVSKWLEHSFKGCIDDSDFRQLVNKGFLVAENVNEKLRREKIIEEIGSNRILNLVIYPTNDCNFRCRYCALDFENKKIANEVKKGIVGFIQKNISKYEGVTLSWFGGEPTLEINSIKEISEKVQKICKTAKKPFMASITTNGYLLTPQNLNILVECGVLTYTVTIDGTKETHDKQRVLANGMGTYDTIIKNLLWLKDNIKSKALNVIIRTNITKEILAKADQCYRELDLLFGSDPRFSLFLRPASDWGGERVKDMYNSLIVGTSLKDMYTAFFSQRGRLIYSRNMDDLDIAMSTCSATFKNKFTIGINGSICKCDDSDDDLAIGHLTPAGEMIIDEDKRLMWERGYRKGQEQCNDCFFSCACFLGVCPKAIILGKQGRCIINNIEIDNSIIYASEVLEGVDVI